MICAPLLNSTSHMEDMETDTEPDMEADMEEGAVPVRRFAVRARRRRAGRGGGDTSVLTEPERSVDRRSQLTEFLSEFLWWRIGSGQ